MQIIAFENRLDNLSALKLMVLSARDVVSSATIHLPTEGMPAEALEWLGDQPNVRLHDDIRFEGEGWNVKIFLLKQFLAKLGGRITWIDADVIIQSDPSPLFADLSPDQLVITEEPYRGTHVGSTIRADAIGLKLGTELGYTANTCIVSVTSAHDRLLRRWEELAKSPDYLAEQALPISGRSLHYFGDQDLLTALLGSAEFNGLPIRKLSSGNHIAHSMLSTDYSLGQRLATIFRGEPVFVHAQGFKVWLHGTDARGRKLLNQQSAYRLSARKYADGLTANDLDWLFGCETYATRTLAAAFANHPSLAGAPLGLIGSVRKTLSRCKQALLGAINHNGKGWTDPISITKSLEQNSKQGDS